MKHEAVDHPKMQDLADRLGIPLYSSNGILERLWNYAGDYSPRGDIGKVTDTAIARAIDWRKKPSALIEALLESKWLDRSDKYRLVIHDWPDHAQEWIRKKLKRDQSDFLPEYDRSVYTDRTLSRQKPVSDAPHGRIGSVGGVGSEDFPEEGLGETKLPAEIPPPRGFHLDEHYAEFRKACEWMDLIQADFVGDAWFVWGKLDRDQRTAAITGIHERRVSGMNPELVPRPKNYLKNHEWTRKIKAKETAMERMIREA